ncbi:MAG: PDZ domain-containing protein [Clostridiales bacterium]|nr:PDZ domain-containing protein [Clostridiales bacterium]MCF8022889.1 PDZ domain-containing protein [Clostridiales bacterium]
MIPFLKIIPLILYKMLIMLLHPIFWLVIILLAFQYKRLNKLKENFWGIKNNRVWQDVMIAGGFGLAGGMVGSILMVVTGVTLGEWLIYLWPVAILLMFINARFLCFAYAGGILSLVKLLFDYPPVQIPQLLALVAILHMVESFLILFSGHLGAVPAYFKDKKGNLVGGFTLQKFWPIPLAVLVVMGSGDIAGQTINMPDWWPVFKPVAVSDPDNLVYAMLSVVAALGYGDLAIARSPREKSKMSFVLLAAYSVILLLLAAAATKSSLFALAGALFSPLGHEAVIHIGKRYEFMQKPRYSPHPGGLRVLDVMPGTPAWNAGMRSGDILFTVNGAPVVNRAHFEYVVHYWTGALELGYLGLKGQNYKRETVSPLSPGQPFGLLFIPEGYEKNFMKTDTEGPLQRWYRKFSRRIKS